jgi:hypothetical protein
VLFTTACEKDDLNTDQLGGSEVLLRSFGPSPIARGAELRIIGTNLDKVESVEIPGAPAITDITRISATEIRVIVPQTAEIGLITLKAAGKTIRSVTQLTYNEPISIDKMTPATVKPGGTIKIEGEYLNLIKEIIFVEDVHVLQADFINQSRQAIEVVIPKTAQTGKIIVSNGADIAPPEGEDPGIPIWVYSDDVLDVILPIITELNPQPVKPGNELTIIGSYFDLVESIKLGDSNLEISEFTVNDDKTEIKISVPEETEIGDVKLIAFSGVEVGVELKLVAPVITGIAPNPAKNKGLLTINGIDLDLVTSVLFAGEVEGSIQSKSATKIEVEIPITALEGAIVLNTHSGQKTESAPLTLVKPVISAIAPLNLTAGDHITLTGTNLDLVSEVIFKSGNASVSVEVTSAEMTTLSLRTPFTATSGTVSLKTVNGTIVTSSQSLTIAPATLPIITEMPKSVKPGALLTIKGVNLETVTGITFIYPSQEIVATKFLPDASGETLQVYTPTTNGDVILRLYAGTDYVESSVLTIGTVDPIYDLSYVFFDFDGKGSWWGSYGAVENDPSLSLDGSQYFRINQDLPDGWVDFFWRNGKNDFKTDDVTVSDWVIKMDVNVLGTTTPPFKFRLNGTDGDFWAIFGGMANKGGWYTVTIPLTDFVDDNGTGTNHLPNVQNISADFGLALAGAGMTNICIDNIRFEPK